MFSHILKNILFEMVHLAPPNLSLSLVWRVFSSIRDTAEACTSWLQQVLEIQVLNNGESSNYIMRRMSCV